MLKKVFGVLAAPFKWGFEAVDARPTGAAYRRVSRQLSAVDGENQGEIALVVGKGRVLNMPVVEIIHAETMVEAVNATLKMVSDMNRSKASAINKAHCNIDKEAASVAKAAELAAKAARKAELMVTKSSGGPAGKEGKAQVVPGKTIRATIRSTDSSPVVGEPVLV